MRRFLLSLLGLSATAFAADLPKIPYCWDVPGFVSGDYVLTLNVGSPKVTKEHILRLLSFSDEDHLKAKFPEATLWHLSITVRGKNLDKQKLLLNQEELRNVVMAEVAGIAARVPIQVKCHPEKKE